VATGSPVSHGPEWSLTEPDALKGLLRTTVVGAIAAAA